LGMRKNSKNQTLVAKKDAAAPRKGKERGQREWKGKKDRSGVDWEKRGKGNNPGNPEKNQQGGGHLSERLLGTKVTTRENDLGVARKIPGEGSLDQGSKNGASAGGRGEARRQAHGGMWGFFCWGWPKRICVQKRGFPEEREIKHGARKRKRGFQLMKRTRRKRKIDRGIKRFQKASHERIRAPNTSGSRHPEKKRIKREGAARGKGENLKKKDRAGGSAESSEGTGRKLSKSRNNQVRQHRGLGEKRQAFRPRKKT